LIAEQNNYFVNEAQEKHDTEQLQAKEKHEWERVYYELKIQKLRLKINDMKKVIIQKLLTIILIISPSYIIYYYNLNI